MNYWEKWETLLRVANACSRERDYNAAILHAEDALILAKQLSPTALATTLHDLADFYSNQDNYKLAQSHYLHAMEIYEECSGTDCPNLIPTLNDLGRLYSNNSTDLHKKAESLYFRAIQINEKRGWYYHQGVAESLNGLAYIYRQARQYKKAESFYRRALEIYGKSLGTHHSNIAYTLGRLGYLYQEQQRYEEAESFYIRALAMYKECLGFDDTSTNDTWHNLASLYESKQEFQKALECYRSSFTNQYNFLRHQFAIISEQDHHFYLKDIKQTLTKLFSLVYTHLNQDRAAIEVMLRAIFLTKALSATTVSTRNAILHTDRYSHLRPKIQEIRNLITQSNNLDYDNPSTVNIFDQIKKIEIEIAKAIPEIMLPESLSIDRQAIASRLPKGSTLIEIILYNDFGNTSDWPVWADEPAGDDWSDVGTTELDRKNSSENVLDWLDSSDRSSSDKLSDSDDSLEWSDSNKYLAFILPQSQPDEMQMVDLGARSDIDELIKACRTAIIQDFPNTAKSTIPTTPPPALIPPQPIPIPQSIDSQAISKLHELLIAPLLPYLDGQHLIIAPDGDLCHLPFNILLPDRIVTYLTTGRDLLRTPNPKSSSTSLVIADPDFDNTAVNHTPVSPISSQQLQTAGIKNLKFDPLPNFGILGRSISDKLNASKYYQRAATKDTITKGSCPHILSILTHGFALPATETETDPMARSGLAFSGANLDKSNILLANEIATLDLHSNNLTILVACETALGDIKHGEGVYGLRRAFTLAGAKTLIATLWEIPVLASVILVEQFFDNLQIHKMGKGAALVAAQTYLRDITKEQLHQTEAGRAALAELQAANYDLEGIECPFAHPYFWAAWICQGETGQMAYTTTRAIGEFKVDGQRVNLRLKQ